MLTAAVLVYDLKIERWLTLSVSTPWEGHRCVHGHAKFLPSCHKTTEDSSHHVTGVRVDC